MGYSRLSRVEITERCNQRMFGSISCLVSTRRVFNLALVDKLVDEIYVKLPFHISYLALKEAANIAQLLYQSNTHLMFYLEICTFCHPNPLQKLKQFYIFYHCNNCCKNSPVLK